MKNGMIRSLFLLGISVTMAMSVAAQTPKLKANDKELKYKSEDAKLKEKNDKDKDKFKGEALKIKDEKDKSKIKGKVAPMQRTMVERTQVKTGESQVKTKEHIEPMESVVEEPAPTESATVAPIAIPEVSAPVKKVATRKFSAHHSTYHKPVAVHKVRTNRPRYIVRTKVVTDTVFVPSPPEKVVSKQTEYVHDTVTVTRVDTVLKVQHENTYTGYAVPRGNFKKVKLRRDKDDGSVWMKRKSKDGKTSTEKIK